MAQTKIKAGLFEGIIGNGTDGYFLMSNGDGTMTWSSLVINPTITSIAYPGSATAADPAGGETITVTGTGFKTGATVTIGGTAAPAVSYVSATQITFTTPAKAAGDYDIVVTNTDTGSATYINGISYNGIPTWTTAAGSLGTFASDTTISTITLQATEPDAGTITFSITNGALPTGLSLTGANIDGTTTLETADTLYTFTVTATDDESQATPRTFTITVTKQLIGTENFTINTYTGTGSTQSIEGKIGTAADFNGSSSKIILPDNLFNVDTDDHSFSLWVKLDNNTSEQQIVFLGNENLRTESGILRFRRYTGAGNDVDSSAVNTNQWYHVVCTFSTTSGMAMYIDGSLIGTNSSTTAMNAGQAKALGIRTDINISYFDGKMDQVRFFNKVLSSSEVTTLYGENNTSSTKSTTDIFNDGSGVALYEFEKGAKDTGGVTGYIGAGGIFNGLQTSSASYIDISSSTTSNTSTVSFWINTTIKDSNYGNIIDAGGGSSGNTGFAIIRNPSNGYLRVNFTNGTTGSTEVFTGTTDITDGNWHHIVLSMASNNTFVLYLDGQSHISGTRTKFTSGDTHNLSNNRLGTNASSVGASSYGGKIDQFRIFNKAISSSEVTTLYQETSASATKSTTDIFDDGSAVALYELEGNANDTGNTYNGTATNVSYAYDGTPTNVSFVGTSFEPDFVWIKSRSNATNNELHDSLRGEPSRLFSDANNAEMTVANGFVSLDSNGFSLDGAGSGGEVNYSGRTYVAWAWKAGGTAVSNTDGSITSSVSANQAAGFSIVSYTGAGTTATVGHGLSSTVELLIVKGRETTNDWSVLHKDNADGNFLQLNGGSAQSGSGSVFGSPTARPTDSVFTIGNTGETGTINKDYIAYCFHSVAGYQKIGSYTGNGSSGGQTITGLGFNPRFLLVKNATASAGWRITDSARGDNTYLYPNLSNADDSSSGYISLITDGFRMNGLDSNTSDTYIYLAIA